MLTLAEIQALLPDNTTGEITPGDLRDVAEALYDWIPPVEKYKMGRLPGETAHADDDFFDDDTLAGTAINHSATVAWLEKYGRMSVKVQDTASNFWFVPRVFPMTPNAAPVTLEIGYQSLGNSDANEQSLYFGFSDGDASTDKILGWLYYYNAGIATIYEVEGTFDNVTFGALYSTLSFDPSCRFFRCIWTAADTVKFGISNHPGQWMSSAVAAHVRGSGITPSHFFVGAGNIDTAVDLIASWDYIRINEADLSP